MSTLDEERRGLKTKIQGLEKEKTEVETKLSVYPPGSRKDISSEEAHLRQRREALGQEIAILVESYENLLLESTEVILQGLAQDSKAVKWLTIWLVVLTAILSVGTMLDVLTRIGWLS